MVYLITGAGFLCKELLKDLLPTKSKIRVYSRSQRSFKGVKEQFGEPKNLTLIQGDIRDKDDLLMAMQGVDKVIHTACEKHVDWCEKFKKEAFKINYIGTYNVLFAAHMSKVKKFLFISTDKAVTPITTYGDTKHYAEELVLHFGSATVKTAIVRYGNVWASSHSVIPLWDELSEKGKTLQLTDEEMTRFFISPKQAVDLVLDSMKKMKGGEIFIPTLKSVKMIDIIKEKYPKSKYEITGIRGKEKIHEELEIGYSSKDTLVSYKELMKELKK